MSFAYGCCVGSWDRFMANVEPRVPEGSLLFATSGHTGIVNAYNAILDGAVNLTYDIEGLILVHDDLEITDPHAEEKFSAALADPLVGLVGVAGGGGESIAWWEHGPIGHQRTDVVDIDFGTRVGDVKYLEGSIMVLSLWAINSLFFDEQFTDFHGYEEISMQVCSAGKRVVVADVDTHHHTQMGFKSTESSEQWMHANELYRRKWFHEA
jgi:hypothetical protein